jgi:hypothetical protein
MTAERFSAMGADTFATVERRCTATNTRRNTELFCRASCCTTSTATNLTIIRNVAQRLRVNGSLEYRPVAPQSPEIPQTPPKEVSSLREATFFQKLEGAGARPDVNYVYAGAKIEDCMALNKSMTNYEQLRSIHLEKFGYTQHVSKGMVYAYGAEHGVSSSLHKGDLSLGYASMLLHQRMKNSDIKEPTIAMIEEGIKQTLCFQALRRTDGFRELTAEKVTELAAKAALLAEHITDKNIRALNNKSLMKEALQTLGNDGRSSCLEFAHIDRVVALNHGDRLKEERQLQQAAEAEHAAKIERMQEYDMGR